MIDLAEWLRDERIAGCEHSTFHFPDSCVVCMRDRFLDSEWLGAHDGALRERLARKVEAERPEVGPHINISHYRQARYDGMTVAASIIRNDGGPV